MAAAILLVIRVERVKMHQHVKFRQNRSISCEDIKIFRFFKMADAAIFDSFGADLYHRQWVLVGHYHSAKFGYDRCSSFYSMNFSIFDAFGWKMPIHAPKIGGFLGNLIPKMGYNINESKKRHTLSWVRVVWAIKRENVVNGLTCRWVT